MENPIFTRSRHAVSQVSVAVLLFVTVFAALGTYFIWLSVQNNAGDAIYIQNVSFKENVTLIYVQNVGSNTVVLDALTINDQVINVNSTNCQVASQNTTILNKESIAQITVFQAFTVRINIKVTCKNGTFNQAWFTP